MVKGFRTIKSWNTKDIHMRDPFVYADLNRRKYFLFGTTFADGCGDKEPIFEVFVGDNLETWKGPYVAFNPPRGFWGVRHYWAPEVFKYKNGKYYMFASFKGGIGEHRGTGVLIADTPEGPYRPHSEGPVTPKDSECLDGTLYIDGNGQPWIVYSHEWTELYEGRIEALRLTEDLRAAKDNNIVEILNAAKMKWIRPFGDPRIEKTGYLTDAPFIYKTDKGKLIMLWSSYSVKGYSISGKGGYTVAVARSENGSMEGPWTNDDTLFLDTNEGHSSLFTDFEGNLRLCLHSPDTPHGMERPKFIKVKESNDSLVLVE